jgi:hypothetical protein
MSVTERIAPASLRPLTPQELGAWFDLQRVTVERLDPSWLPSLAGELVVEARGTPTGRRWLAERLSGVTPLLFAIPCGVGAASVRELHDLGWFGAALREPRERALDLGSLLLAARLRTVVSRSAVTHLRTMLGVERYERTLTASLADVTAPAVPRASMQTSDEADVLVRQMLRHGAHELAAFAFHLHAVFAQSVKLSFERDWWCCPYPATLHPDTVAAWLGLERPPTVVG